MSAKTEIQEFRKRETSDLLVELGEKRRECFDIRFQQASEKAANPQLLRALRKDVARILTVLRERELAGEEA
jgi:large subunit ribosomal protein L29